MFKVQGFRAKAYLDLLDIFFVESRFWLQHPLSRAYNPLGVESPQASVR